MQATIRRATGSDKQAFVEFSLKLSRFNRSRHSDNCKYDDYNEILKGIEREAESAFDARNNDTSILIAELDGKLVGFAAGRIYEEDATADNGAGRMGLFDKLFLDDSARGFGLGQKLLDETMAWFKQKGIHRVKLLAFSWNDHAKAIYERNGFKEYAVSYEKFL